MEDKKRYTKIDPTQYVQYTGPTRRYPRVNPFEKKTIIPEKTTTTEDKDAEKGQADAEQQQKQAETERD